MHKKAVDTQYIIGASAGLFYWNWGSLAMFNLCKQ